MANSIADVIVVVEAQTGTVASAVTLLTELHKLLVDAGTDQVKLDELANKIQGNTDALAAAVAANPLP